MFNGVRPESKALNAVSALLRSSSESMANLEVPITDKGKKTERKSAKELKARSQFILRADPKHKLSLVNSGLTFVTQANNHCMDYGAAGIEQESQILDSIGILHTGAGSNVRDAEKTVTKSIPGRPSIGLVSVMAFATTAALRKTSPATSSEPGIAVLNFGGALTKLSLLKLSHRIQQAHIGCDVLVVGIHWGVERKATPNGYQVALGRALIDAGADVVWGHHPHVLEGAELYRGKPIFYSTGNLVSALPANTGLFTLFYKDRAVSKAEFHPAKIRNGKASLATGRDATVAIRSYHELCRALLKKYPCKDSTALF